MSRRATYKQMPLPYDAADLRQPLRPVPPACIETAHVLPPGLREFAREVNLREARVQQLAQAWHTIRGHKPTTVDEWRTFCAAIKAYIWEDEYHAD